MASLSGSHRPRAAAVSHRIEELREDFLAVDADQDGRIDLAEFRMLMDTLDAGMSERTMRIGFEEIDADHDGYISLGEFIAWRSE